MFCNVWDGLTATGPWAGLGHEPLQRETNRGPHRTFVLPAWKLELYPEVLVELYALRREHVSCPVLENVWEAFETWHEMARAW